MKSRKLAMFIIFLLSAVTAGAQTFTLSGKVTDPEGAGLELATVACVAQGKVTMTDLSGNYSIQLASADSVEVRFSMVGYKTKTRVLRRPKGKQTIILQLSDDNSLQEVTVTSRIRQTTGTEQLDVKNIQHTPSATGNAVEEMIQSQAGVSTHSELSSQYNVRGGSFDENSVYINNVEVYRPFLVRSGQQEGLSIINADMVEKVGFSTGGFEAKYGDKMSSALDITYRRPKAFEAKVQGSLLGASAFVGLGGKKFSWSNGLRYKTNRYLLGSMETKGEYNPNFLDYQTYLTYEPNKRWTLELMGDISNNQYDFSPSDRETSFGTQADVKSFKVYFDGQEKDLFRTFFGSATLTRHFTENTHLSVGFSAFHTNERETYDIQGQYWLTQTETSENLGVGSYMEHARNYLKANVQSLRARFTSKKGKHSFDSGITYRWEDISERMREYEMRDSSGYTVPHTGNDLRMIYTLSARNNLKAHRLEFYAQDTYRFTSPSEKTLYTLCYGVRFANWSFNGESIVSPRASLAIIPAFNNDVTFRFATGLYYQSPFFKELRDTTTVDGITYATLNNKIKSQRSIHFLAAYDYQFRMLNRPFRFTAEAYYKLMGNLIPYSVNNVKVVYDSNEQVSGHAMGIDFKLFGEFVEGSDSWVTFSLMNTRYKLHGNSIPLPTDQRYSFNLFFTDYFPGTTKWKMSLKLAFADGLPFGAPHRDLSDTPFRAPAYKRCDIGMSYQLYDGKAAKNKTVKNIWLGVDCLNLFGINNVNSYYWITDVNNYQYAVPNYLTGRQINGKISVEF